MLVRSWNLYHGMTSPKGRHSHLEEAVRLVSSDRPDVVCLQEVPLWGCANLEDWSGMTVFWHSARRVWFPPGLGGAVTQLNQGFFRSAISGQANAILLRPRLVPTVENWTTISRGRRERRICEAVRADTMVIANLHASSEPNRPEVAGAEILRALTFAESIAEPDDMIVLAGDFNLLPDQLPELPDFSPPGPRIDHILVHGGKAGPLEVWPQAEHTTASGVLSDHAPVQLRVGE